MSRVPSAYSVVEQNVLLGGGFKRIFDGDQKSGRAGGPKQSICRENAAEQACTSKEKAEQRQRNRVGRWLNTPSSPDSRRRWRPQTQIQPPPSSRNDRSWPDWAGAP